MPKTRTALLTHALPPLFYQARVQSAFSRLVDALQETPASFPCAIAEKVCLGAEMAGAHPVEGLDDLAFNVPREALPEFFEFAAVVYKESLNDDCNSTGDFVRRFANVVASRDIALDENGKLPPSIWDAPLLDWESLVDQFKTEFKWDKGQHPGERARTAFHDELKRIRRIETRWSKIIFAWKKAHRFYRLLKRCDDGLGPRGSFAEWAGSSEAMRCLQSVSHVLDKSEK